MLDLEKITREKAEDQLVDDGVGDEAGEDDDDICDLQSSGRSREENKNEWLLSFIQLLWCFNPSVQYIFGDAVKVLTKGLVVSWCVSSTGF